MESLHAEYRYAEFSFYTVMLRVRMLNVVMLMMRVIMLNVVALVSALNEGRDLTYRALG
jgi:hypothetical protein